METRNKLVRILFAAALAALFLWLPRLGAQSSGAAHLTGGKEIYEAGCAGCHGADGRGAPQSTIAFEKPDTFPDFTECDQTTPEDNLAWKSVIRDGGPSRGFSQIMPSFGEALTSEQIDAVVAYMRGFCKGKGWARGELNMPRALITEKAFPENEEVITTSVNVKGAPGVSNEYVHEQRIGKKDQIEVSVPIDLVRPAQGLWYGGIGDVGVGLKHQIFASLHSILSFQGEVLLPTGSTGHGLGSGVATVETFAAYGQLLPWRTFVQVQGGAELPVDTSKASQAVFFRTAVGKSFNQKYGLGRLWSPMMEFLADRDFASGALTYWDVLPQMQVTISKRQHVRLNIGVRLPATNTVGRQPQLMMYLLWDWQDGRLLEGW